MSASKTTADKIKQPDASRQSRSGERPRPEPTGEHPILRLQRVAGNQAVQRLLRSMGLARRLACQPQVGRDPAPAARIGSTRGAGRTPAFFVPEGKSETDTICPEEPGEEQDAVTPGSAPRYFVDLGVSGEETYHLVRGRGGRGLQRAGTIQEEVRPAIMHDPENESLGYVRSALMTGIARVARSYIAVSSGDQGVDSQNRRWFITPAAADRINDHEEMHIAETQRIHDNTIAPMERRIADSIAPTMRSEIERYIAWGTTLQQFRRDDIVRNDRGGTMDQEEQARSSIPQPYPSDVVVGGVTYQRYMKMPREELPQEEAGTPAPAPHGRRPAARGTP